MRVPLLTRYKAALFQCPEQSPACVVQQDHRFGTMVFRPAKGSVVRNNSQQGEDNMPRVENLVRLLISSSRLRSVPMTRTADSWQL